MASSERAGRCPTVSGSFQCDLSRGHQGECVTRQAGCAAWIGPALAPTHLRIVIAASEHVHAQHTAELQRAVQRAEALAANAHAIRGMPHVTAMSRPAPPLTEAEASSTPPLGPPTPPTAPEGRAPTPSTNNVTANRVPSGRVRPRGTLLSRTPPTGSPRSSTRRGKAPDGHRDETSPTGHAPEGPTGRSKRDPLSKPHLDPLLRTKK